MAGATAGTGTTEGAVGTTVDVAGAGGTARGVTGVAGTTNGVGAAEDVVDSVTEHTGRKAESAMSALAGDMVDVADTVTGALNVADAVTDALVGVTGHRDDVVTDTEDGVSDAEGGMVADTDVGVTDTDVGVTDAVGSAIEAAFDVSDMVRVPLGRVRKDPDYSNFFSP